MDNTLRKGQFGDSEPLGRILIVDDEPDLVSLLATVLESSGYSVYPSSSADHAIAYILKNKIDLILTDVKMPGGSGFDLMGLSEFINEDVPVIIMSGHVDEDTLILDGVGEGAIDYLQKPFTMEHLIDTVRKNLNSKKAVAA